MGCIKQESFHDTHSFGCADVNQSLLLCEYVFLYCSNWTVSCYRQLVGMSGEGTGEDSAGGGNEEGGGSHCGDNDGR